ncbi:MAG: DUF86 domain-containing protein [Candidatus Liptonbacteria bacterium]|nr:DUF86 domain-containing protein [Candidatus Liptonbacteria bacterium]
MTLDFALVEKKLHLLAGYVGEIKPFVAEFSDDDILKDSVKYHALERVFQLAVDAMIDINRHIIKEKHLGAPDDLEGTFRLLGEMNVIEKNFAFTIAPIVGVRNMIVHQYEKLDRALFVRNTKKNYGDFGEYTRQVRAFVGKEK